MQMTVWAIFVYHLIFPLGFNTTLGTFATAQECNIALSQQHFALGFDGVCKPMVVPAPMRR